MLVLGENLLYGLTKIWQAPDECMRNIIVAPAAGTKWKRRTAILLG